MRVLVLLEEEEILLSSDVTFMQVFDFLLFLIVSTGIYFKKPYIFNQAD